MSTHDHDNDALPGEDELKALYRSLPRKEPSPELDRAVKRAAADAVRSTRRPAPRWPVAVASFAMVVVAAGLGWRMMEQPTSVPQMTSAPRAPAATAPASSPEPPAPMPQATQAPAIDTAAKPAPARISRKAEAPLLPERESIRSAMKPKIVARTVAPTPPPIVLEQAAPAMQAPQASANAVFAPPPAPPAPPAAPVMEAAPVVEAPAPALANTSSNAPMAGQSAHAAMRVMAAPAPMPAPAPALDATAFNPTDTPEQELGKIRQLFALHRHDEAMQRLTAFQKAHPDVALPDDLRAQLPDHE